MPHLAIRVVDHERIRRIEPEAHSLAVRPDFVHVSHGVPVIGAVAIIVSLNITVLFNVTHMKLKYKMKSLLIEDALQFVPTLSSKASRILSP